MVKNIYKHKSLIMSLSCYCITCHYNIFLHGYAHYAFASTIEFHGEFHRSDRNNNSVWQNCDQRRRIAREATDRQSLSPSLSVRGNVPKKRETRFRERETIIDTCVVSRRQACWQLQKDPLLPCLFVSDPHRKIHRCGHAYFARRFTEWGKYFPTPLLRGRKRILYKMISNISMTFRLVKEREYYDYKSIHTFFFFFFYEDTSMYLYKKFISEK